MLLTKPYNKNWSGLLLFLLPFPPGWKGGNETKKWLKRLHSQGGVGNLPCKSSTDKLLAICERINQHLLFWPPFLTPLIWLLYIPRDRYADEASSSS